MCGANGGHEPKTAALLHFHPFLCKEHWALSRRTGLRRPFVVTHRTSSCEGELQSAIQLRYNTTGLSNPWRARPPPGPLGPPALRPTRTPGKAKPKHSFWYWWALDVSFSWLVSTCTSLLAWALLALWALSTCSTRLRINLEHSLGTDTAGLTFGFRKRPRSPQVCFEWFWARALPPVICTLLPMASRRRTPRSMRDRSVWHYTTFCESFREQRSERATRSNSYNRSFV